MTGIVISSRDAERIAKSFSDLIGPKGLDRIRRKAVNTVGSSLRKQTRIIAPAIIGTSAAALSVQGKAVTPGSTNPRYVLRMARKIPVAKIKAKNRKITRRSGRASLALTLPSGDKIVFRSVNRDGASFRLLRAGPLPERALGGIYTNAARAFTKEGYDELYQLRRGAEKDLVQAVSEALKNGAYKLVLISLDLVARPA